MHLKQMGKDLKTWRIYTGLYCPLNQPQSHPREPFLYPEHSLQNEEQGLEIQLWMICVFLKIFWRKIEKKHAFENGVCIDTCQPMAGRCQ